MQDIITFDFDYTPEEMVVEKEAKIFEAGEFPDKGIAVSEGDLDTIVSNFTEVPVKVEHTDSPLDPLGVVKRVWRQGKDLFARLAFPGDMAEFLQRRGVRKLSVALCKDPLRLSEVSLVLTPRIQSAAMFAEGDITDSQFGGEVDVNMNKDEQAKDREIEELKFALRAKDVEMRLESLKAQGKIVPASEAYAREIMLRGDGKITFGEGETTLAYLFEAFMESQPKVIAFGELSTASRGSGMPLSEEDEELLARLGVTREQVEKYSG